MTIELVANNDPEDIQRYKDGMKIVYLICKDCNLRKAARLNEIKDHLDDCHKGARCRARIFNKL